MSILQTISSSKCVFEVILTFVKTLTNTLTNTLAQQLGSGFVNFMVVCPSCTALYDFSTFSFFLNIIFFWGGDCCADVLMFEDDAWVEVSDAKYVSWEQTIKTEMEASKEENAPKKLVILEIGCGTRVSA